MSTVFNIVLTLLGGGAQRLDDPDGKPLAVQVPKLGVVYPYQNEPWAYKEEWRSDRRDTAPGYDGWPLDYSAVFYNINNEPSDVISNLSDPDTLKRLSDRRRRETDGLPRMVEITLFATDSRGILSMPTQFSTRVYLALR